MAGIDVTSISTELNKFGGSLLKKSVNQAKFKADFEVLRNVKQPIVLPRIATVGEPRPYRPQRDETGNKVKFSDRRMVVMQSKLDMEDFDPEVYRNTYLAAAADGRLDPNKNPFYSDLLNKIDEDYWAAINDKVVLAGSYNASGTTAADIATGIGTLIAAEITAGEIVPITTGAITNANAVAKVETLHNALPAWMKERGATIFCSYDILQKYKENYRATFGYTFKPNEMGEYMLDGTQTKLVARSWMAASQRLICVPSDKKNLYFGTDTDSMEFYATPVLNLLQIRVLFPIAFQIADLDALFVNDQA
jgi:hypothetical protein